MNANASASDIDVARICELAHFCLSEEERDRFQKELEPIVAYVRKLTELDLDGVEPTKFGQPVSNVLREDIVEPSLAHDTVLANAPDADENEFRMPKIVE